MSADAKVLTREEEEALEAAPSPTLFKPKKGRKKAGANGAPEPALPDAPPSMEDPGWSDYVMGLFAEGELSRDGHPNVAGLRRLVRLLLGDILSSEALVVRPPEVVAAAGRKDSLSPAVVQHRVTILWKNSEGKPAHEAVFSEVADCWSGNCEPQFAAYPTAMASTRAEARALRKALQLRKCAAEEIGPVPLEDEPPAAVSHAKVQALAAMCERVNVNVKKFINSGQAKFDSVEDVPRDTLIKMENVLSCYQRNRDSIPPHILGFDPNWRG